MASVYTSLVHKDDMKVIKWAVTQINKDSETKFVLSSSQDKDEVLDGNVMTIEAKHVFIATMVSGHWDTLIKKYPKFAGKKIPAPSDCKAGFLITRSKFWPPPIDQDGLIGNAADMQADTIADAAFTKLMYTVNKKQPKAHADLFKPAPAPDQAADDDAMDVDMTEATATTTATATAAAKVPDPTKLFPAAWSVKPGYRLTRDWTHWPSAGELPGSELSNVSQAQYGMIADNIFEHMKVEVIASKAKKAKSTIGEVDEVAVELAADQGARTVYFDMLERFEDNEGHVVKKTGAKNTLDHAYEFRDFVLDIAKDHPEEMEYISDEGRDTRFDHVLQGLQDDTIAQFYPRAGRAFSLYIKDRDDGSGSDREVSVGAPSLADDASDGETYVPPKTGDKRSRGTEVDDDEEDEEPIPKGRRIATATGTGGRATRASTSGK